MKRESSFNLKAEKVWKSAQHKLRKTKRKQEIDIVISLHNKASSSVPHMDIIINALSIASQARRETANSHALTTFRSTTATSDSTM